MSQTNLFNEQFADEYDTILMLMNGSGIIGKLENLPDFFRKMKLLLRPGGCVLMDSSNLSYLSVSYTHLDVYKRQVQGDDIRIVI